MVYRVQMIPVENKDTHKLSPVAEIKKKKQTKQVFVHMEYPFNLTS